MSSSIQIKYAIYGFAFGLFFPLSAWLIDLISSGSVFSLASLILIHKNNILHYIIDAAPFVLGLVFLFLGRSNQLAIGKMAELKEQSDKSTLLLNSTGEAIYGINLDGNCTFANTVCIRMLAYETEADLLGKNMHELIHHTHDDGSSFPVEDCKIFKTFQEGTASHVDDEVLWRADGSCFNSEYRSYPVYDDDKVVGSVVSFTDITARLKLERETQENISNLVRFKLAMGQIVLVKESLKDEIGIESIEEKILEITADAIKVERISLWTFSSDRSNIVASALYLRSEERFEHGMELSSMDYPAYFEALAEDSVIVADNAETDPRTCEFKDHYLRPFGISSMLDVPIRIRGKAIGILCCEHVGEARKWNLFEQEFVASVAISLALAQESSSLIESENRQKVVVETMVDGLITIDEGGEIKSFNPAAEKIFDYSAEEIIGTNVSQLMPKPHSEQHHKYLKRYKTTGEAHILGVAGIEVDGLRKDGSAVPVAISISEMFIGTQHLYSGVIRDITEKKALERDQAKATAELTQLLNSFSLAVFSIDLERNIQEWNRMSVELSGYSREEARNMDIVKTLFHKDSRAKVRRIIAKAFKGIGTFKSEVSIVTKAGVEHHLVFTVTSKLDMDGNITGAVGDVQDISATKEAQADSLRVGEELTQLIDTANAPIFGINTRLQITEWNQAAEKIIGFDKSEVMSCMFINEFVDDENKETVRAIFEDALKGKETANFELHLRTKTGAMANILFNTTTRRDIKGNITGVTGIGQDITELREKENALNQAQKMEAVGQLTGGIAHDFNNLLSIISGNLRFLEQDIGEVSTEIKELFEDAMSAADDGAELTQRLLAFSRNRALKPEVKNVNEVIEKFARFLTRTLGENIELRIDLPEENMFVRVDPSQLENALLNLSLNARDAMPEGGSITIAGARYHRGNGNGNGNGNDDDDRKSLLLPHGDYIKISVTDTGTGISPADLSHIFEPFFTTKEVGKGSGLGLSMVYGFAHQSQGDCGVSSILGEGTSISIYLPETKGEERKEILRINSDLSLRGSEVVLVVEDEPRVRRVTLRDLKKLGYRTLEAENADIAKAMIESGEHIDLLFSDVVMPGEMDGHMLGIWVEENHSNIRVVLTSGYSKGKADASKDKVRPFPLLRKPYSIEKLAKQIRATLSESR